MAERTYRCAIYTRKSTEDGLEQEFNSLDAQHAACAAYALSQQHEGWTLSGERYDDGGFSGGNMQRPGLKRLLADVAAGRVDIILLYKIDRLTRSLADFAKIVEVLDAASASFVSITQSFNTTTSMGRLTLNMLLSFAQFEREVTGERIRDKIAASKRKGIWMGGPVPLGYDVRARKLVVNDSEAKLVRHIMRRYLALSSVPELVDELARDGHRTKLQYNASGPKRGGCAFRRGTLYHLLANQVYRGKLTHKGEYFDAEHEAIVSEELWVDVQAALTARAQGHARRIKAKHPSLLVGKLNDGRGRAMSPSHTNKLGVRYRYYATRSDQLDGEPAWRVSAHDLEELVFTRIAEWTDDQRELCDWLGPSQHDAQLVRAVIAAGAAMASVLRSGGPAARIELVEKVLRQVDLCKESIDIELDGAGLRSMLGAELAPTACSGAVSLSCPAIRVRRGHEVRLVIPAPDQPPVPTRNEKLVSLITDAHTAGEGVKAHPDKSIAEIAKQAGICRTRLSQLVTLSCLAPDIVIAILEGRQPPSLTARCLLACELPLAWSEQRLAFGFC
ncbi:recombinase family protein [Parablastomonas sp. CN1-191]|uniref:recombinase family protein n=1 Tax=Parablastomonas sp. CN1-191 TaxID=3400908 RepID=UPI003BF91939